MGGLLAAEAMMGDPVVIEPIGITKSLEEHGYTPAIAARRLRDEMTMIVAQTRTYKERRGFQTSDAQLDVEDPLSGMSLRSLLRLGRSFFGVGETRLSGEIVEDGGRFHLNLRSTRSEMGVARIAQPRLSGDEKRGAEELLRAAAVAALRMTDPVLLAAHRFDQAFAIDPASGAADRRALAEALDLLDEHLARGIGDDLVRAHNLYGLVLYHRGEYRGALGHYARAAHAAADDRGADATIMATLYANWGDALVALHDDAEAEKKFALAIRHEPSRAGHHLDRGNALLRLGRVAEGAASLETAAALDRLAAL
jgi:tetratricopeptide (TPR) repeat protein